MMFSQILLALALATFSLAYQLATWTRVDTDPLNFTAVLTNEDRSVMPQNNQILAALVDGTLGQIRLNPPNGGWPTGKAFRLNFCRDSQSLEAILAQSNQFDIGQTTSVPLSTPRSTTTPVANTSPAATVTQTPPTTSVGAASPSQTSNGAVSVEAKKGGILGLMGFLALMVV
ncbi:hypothetical protein AB1N83_000296 [Pleurotus pulmonarius]